MNNEEIFEDEKKSILIKKRKKIENVKLVPLLPIKINKDYEYINQLKIAIKNKEICNIALTGPFGAGKSSVLKTFKEDVKKDKLFRKEKFIDISLASFNEKYDNNRDYFESIEKGILQQLIYKVNSEKIPNSRFKRIEERHTIKGTFLILFLIVIWLIIWSIYKYLVKAEEVQAVLDNFFVIKNYFTNYLFTTSDSNFVKYIKIGVGIFPLIVMLWIAIYIPTRFALRYLKISKVVVKDIELSKKENDNQSIFNKYLDEILYFFKKSKYTIVILEDLDRFENSKEIFIKLRELNKLINNNEYFEKKRILFIYSIKDDLFNSEEKIKFFDLIIPIIPVMSTFNAEDRILEQLKKVRLDGEISKDFIKDISKYIQDMRLLQNICNEYLIYRKIIFSEDEDIKIEDRNKLFAIIVYKNMNSKDFYNMQYQNGDINFLIDAVNIVLEMFNEECIKKEKRIKTLQKEKQIKIRNIKNKVWKLFDETTLDCTKVIFYKNNIMNKSDFFDNQFKIDEIKELYMYGNENVRITIKDLERNLYPEDKYIYIYGKIINDNVKIKELKNNVSILKKYLECFRKNPIQKIYYDKEVIRRLISYIINNKSKYIECYKKYEASIDTILNNNILLFLVRKGYMDENYEKYINIVPENEYLSSNDKKFLENVTNQNVTNYDYRLDDVEKVCYKLDEKDFENKYILNNDLIEYISQHDDIYDKERRNIVKMLYKDIDDELKFIDQYVGDKNSVYLFKGNSNWLWEKIYTIKNFKIADFYLNAVINCKECKSLKFYTVVQAFEKSFSNSNKIRFLNSVGHIFDNSQIDILIEYLEKEYRKLSRNNDSDGIYNT